MLIAVSLVLLAAQYTGGQQVTLPATTSTPTVAAPTPQLTPQSTETRSPAVTPTNLAITSTPQGTATQAAAFAPSPTTSLASSAAEQTLQALEAEQVPVRDLYSITLRLKLKTDKPLSRTVEGQAGNYPVGHADTFYMSDILAKRYYTITATLLKVTEHAYWYVQEGQQVEATVLEDAARAFEQQIYPTNHRLFGMEWVPGVDNDPRMTVLIAHIPGAGGYFVSADEYTQAVNPFSNQREIIYVSMGDVAGLGSTLAHEHQHMIHWYQNPGHDVWINEGASMLAQDINGYGAGGVEQAFETRPDLQLNTWQSNPELSRGNYGAAFLFFDFLRAHYGGDQALRSLVAAKGRGIDAVDNALKDLGSQDDFLSVFKRWTLANLLDGEDGASEQGIDYPGREVQVSPQSLVDDYPRSLADTVSQFGTDYIELTPPDSGSTLQISFAGDKETRLIPSPARSGQGIWWSNRGDQADSSMTRRFDLRSVSSATLNFSTWFRIEDDLDYGYVEASTDSGATWATLEGEFTTSSNPNGNNLGYGYTGKSADKPGADPDGWLQERIDL
ncbi:MAG: hypothetical protein QOH93_3103, partial [Chloroflexia bacterium]|nr:hypothetical protein [Chloroflexia bacterium]